MSRQVAIGVDVGGTKIAAAGVDVQSGELLVREEIPTLRHEDGERVLERLYQMVRSIHGQLVQQNIEPLGVGIGVPELVNNSGVITSHWNFDWDQRSVNDRLAEFGTIVLESDARTAAMAESFLGHGTVYPSFVFVTIGSGLSSAFCSNGEVHRGAHGYAIHFGSADIMAVCNKCGAQEGFNLEAFASGRGLAETFRIRTSKTADARDLISRPTDRDAAALLGEASLALASYLGQLVNILDPHALVLGGGLGSTPAFFDVVEKQIRPFIWAEDGRTIPIVSSAIPRDGATIGAAAIFRSSALRKSAKNL